MNDDEDRPGGDDMLRWYYGGAAPEGDAGDASDGGPAVDGRAAEVHHLDIANGFHTGQTAEGGWQRSVEADGDFGGLLQSTPVTSRVGRTTAAVR